MGGECSWHPANVSESPKLRYPRWRTLCHNFIKLISSLHPTYVQVFDQCITKVISPSSGTVADIANPMRHTGNNVRMDFEFIEDAFNYIVDVDPNDKESKQWQSDVYRRACDVSASLMKLCALPYMIGFRS